MNETQYDELKEEDRIEQIDPYHRYDVTGSFDGVEEE